MELNNEVRKSVLRRPYAQSVSQKSGLRQSGSGVRGETGETGERRRSLPPLQDAPSVAGIQGPIQEITQIVPLDLMEGSKQCPS